MGMGGMGGLGGFGMGFDRHRHWLDSKFKNINIRFNNIINWNVLIFWADSFACQNSFECKLIKQWLFRKKYIFIWILTSARAIYESICNLIYV